MKLQISMMKSLKLAELLPLTEKLIKLVPPMEVVDERVVSKYFSCSSLKMGRFPHFDSYFSKGL